MGQAVNRDKKKISEIKIGILMLFLLLFTVFCFFLNIRVHSATVKAMDNSGEAVLDTLTFYVDNGGQVLKVKAYRDITTEPAVYCVFLPSFSKGKDIHVYFELRDHLILKAPDGSESVVYNGGELPDMVLKQTYELYTVDDNGDNREHTEISFYNSDDTAAVFIDTESGSMEYLNEDKENSEPGLIQILDEDGNTEYRGKLKEIKGHGNSTWMRAKKPYGFKLYKKANLFNMGSSKNWVLLSNSMDLSMMRNSLVYDMARALGFPATPEVHYADVYLNGIYNGLYILSATTEVADNRLNITDLDRINKSLNIVPPSGAERVEEHYGDQAYSTGVKLPVLPDDISGGYIIEHDYGFKFDSEPSRFLTPQGESYVIKSPAYSPIEEVRYVYDLFTELESKASSGEDLSGLIDLKSFVKIYVLDEFTRNEGAGVTSAYYYKDRDESDPLIHAGPVWDYDQCLGNTYFPVVNEPRSLNFCTDHIKSTRLFYDLYMNHPEFREGVMDYYENEFRPVIKGFYDRGLDQYLEKVLSDNDMNNRRWGNNDSAIRDSVREAFDFMGSRIEFLDEVWIDRKPIKMINISDNVGRNIDIGILKDSDIPDNLKPLLQ